MSDFSSGAIVDDDLDFSAAQSCAKTCDAADAKEAAWGGRGLNIAIGVSALVMVAGIALWAMQLAGGMVQTGMRNLNSWGLYITSFMFFVGLRHPGLRRHLQGRRHELNRLHGDGHRLGRGGHGPALPRVGALRVLQPG